MTRTPEFSRSKIDRLGDRLRKDTYSDEDLRLLDSYRRSFTDASEHVVKEIRDQLVGQLKALFEDCTVVDRREHSSHGYRAVHIIIPYSGKLIEVQVRTSLQHRWAELSEKLSDVVEPSIKYGEGDKDVLLILARLSDRIKEHEKKETELAHLIETEGSENVFELAWDVYDMKEDIRRVLNAIDEDIPPAKGRKDDLSD